MKSGAIVRHPMRHYFQRGGLRWGKSYWGGANATWPFAAVDVTMEGLSVSVGWGPLKRVFDFKRNEIRSLALQHGIISIGLRIEHSRPDYPPFILFWTFKPRGLSANLRQLGYTVSDSKSWAWMRPA
jgi:hypothetical protein